MAAEAIKFIQANKDHPFFLNYWAFSVHAPFDGKADLTAKYRAKADPNDPQRCPVYGAMVQSLDENVGRLLDTLDELKLTENTIIVFFSDNGGNMYDRVEGIPPTSNAPLRGGKATLYEGGTREPCVVVWPGKVKPGSRSDALLSSVDWYPTLLEMAGVTTEAAGEIRRREPDAGAARRRRAARYGVLLFPALHARHRRAARDVGPPRRLETDPFLLRQPGSERPLRTVQLEGRHR